MALEYSLYVANEKPLENILHVLNGLAWEYEVINESDNLFLLNFWEQKGFNLSIVQKKNRLIELEDKELQYKSFILIRLNKVYDPEQVKKNILKIVVAIIKEFNLDLVLIFNGEIVVLLNEKDHGLYIDTQNDFWANGILKEVTDLNYLNSTFTML